MASPRTKAKEPGYPRRKKPVCQVINQHCMRMFIYNWPRISDQIIVNCIPPGNIHPISTDETSMPRNEKE